MKKYTVQEIDELRQAYTLRWLYGSTVSDVGSLGFSRTYTQEEKVKCVEELVRTAMLAGIIAEEVYEEDRKKIRNAAC